MYTNWTGGLSSLSYTDYKWPRGLSSLKSVQAALVPFNKCTGGLSSLKSVQAALVLSAPC